MEDGQPLVTKEEDLFSGCYRQSAPACQRNSKFNIKKLPENAILISPLAIGKHIDHQIVKNGIN